MDYQMSEPIETIYKAITDFGRMCTSVKVSSTDLQLIGVGLVIFNKSNLMTKFVTKWEKKDLALKNLATFKSHFCADHRDVRSEASSEIAGYFGHHTNSVIEAMIVQEQKAAEQMTQQLEESQARETAQSDQMRVLTEQMNLMQQQFLQQQQKMMANFTAFRTAGGTPVPARQTTTNDSDWNKIKGKSTKKYNAKVYCWTHGVGHHGN